MSEGYWRWNVDSIWENFSSLCQENFLAKNAKNEFQQYHHTKAALYFGMGCVESFLNKLMRQELTEQGASENEIYKKMRVNLYDKLNIWTKDFCGDNTPPSDDVLKLLDSFRTIRNEITHPKAKDHSIYKDIDGLKQLDVQDIIAEYIIGVYSARSEIFPYWLFGVNFVGMNGDYSWPCLSNNTDFLHSLQWMGFNIPSITYEGDAWQRQCMSSLKAYRDGIVVLKKAGCEARYKAYPSKPRLCWQWWDDIHVKQCGLPAR